MKTCRFAQKFLHFEKQMVDIHLSYILYALENDDSCE